MKRQWRLRTAIAGIAVAALPLAWIARDYREASRENAIASQLLGHSAIVVTTKQTLRYGWSGRREHVHRVELLKDHYRLDADQGPQTISVDLGAMSRLPHLRELSIQGDLLAPNDFQHLGRLNQLDKLLLSHAPIDDEQLQQLATLKNLRELTLEATAVTDEGLDRLRAALPDLQIFDD